MTDQAPLTATTTPVGNLFGASGPDLDALINRQPAARGITNARGDKICTRGEVGGSESKLAHHFVVIEDLLRDLPPMRTADE